MKSQLLRNILVNTGVVAVLIGILVAAFYYYGIRMPGKSYTGPLPAMTPGLEKLRDRLREHVKFLAGDIGERNQGKLGKLQQAADYIEQQFAALKYVPQSEVIDAKGNRNIVVDLYGKKNRNRIIVVGAHYDTTWYTPGADDNASGVAALLELARALHGKKLPITIRFVAFVNEEFPYYGTNDMGSLYHAQHARETNEDIVGMFSLEMLGFYSDEPHSQYYPHLIRSFYPRRGNFIAFVSNLVSRPLLIKAISDFRKQARFPSQGLAAPQWLVPAIRRSDHASFWANGYQAVMITDTANYRNYSYHNVGDTYKTLDYNRMARVVDGLRKMLETLASQYQ